ncbi:ankyrin repeats (many copies) domain-containing protein [Trichoderma breve]|uniref:Ankyrin repeats (Many copies) domain-containing protein n=1 Tax=Trichoderma breve TaxID=2034170 RepID=A0A9W9B8T2_9HYPO|nr:ankyrin repeats (many copies) domain-containing protein [Trichoderma breve]KAJ4858728.1 ankyrin repeats (many copies) domain-containing protein [Trichoderma breve]
MLSNGDCSWGCYKFFPEAEQAPEVEHHQAAKASSNHLCVHAFLTQSKKFFSSDTIMGFKRWLQKQRQKHSSSSSTNEIVAVNSGQGRQNGTNAIGSRNTDDSIDDQTDRNETNERSKASKVDYAPSTLDNIPIQELWNVAYERLREENGPLIAEYESSLKGVVAAGVAQTLSFKANIREQMWTILQKRMEEVNNNTKLKLGDHEIQMNTSQLILNVINAANNYISQAVSGNPFASIAWTGISFLLPLFINASAESASLAKGLEYISSLITQSKMREELYIEARDHELRVRDHEKFQLSHREYKAALERLYRQILKFEAKSCCYYSSKFRIGLDAVKWNDWEQLIGDVREKEQSFSAIEQIWRDIRHVEEQLANESAVAQQEHREFLSWLSDVDPSSTYNDARVRYENGTNEWLLKGSEVFKAWETNAKSLIWLHGKAGSGKSVLTSSVINYLEDQHALKPSTALAYFYFSFSDIKKQQVNGMLASLIKQICSDRPGVSQLNDIKRLNDYKTKGQRPDTQTLETALLSSTSGCSAVYIIIDGLDECPLLGGQREQLLKSLRRILTTASDNFHTFLTSRKEPDINLGIRPLLSSPAKIEIDLLSHQQAINDDVQQYINLTLATEDFNTWPDEVKEEARQLLIRKADCMFQYVRLQLEALRIPSSIAEVRKALHDLPVGLDATYDRILQNIDTRFQSQVINSLKWLAFSKTTLTDGEVSDIFIIHPDDDVVFDETERLFSSTDILKYFSGLIVTLPNYRTIVRLAHFSIKEYLTSRRIAGNPTSAFSFTEIDAHLYITKSCLAYLEYFTAITKTKWEESYESIEHFPLVRYVTKYWALHLEEVPRSSWPTGVTEDAVLALAVRSRSLHLQLHLEKNTSMNPHMLHASLKPHCYTALRGFHQLTELLISQECGANKYLTQEDLDFGLHVAAHEGHLDIVRLFLEAGANINTRCDDWESALDAAAEGQHFDVLKLLISYGTDDSHSQSSLSHSLCRDARSMTILLDSGADIDKQIGYSGTALCLAAAASDSVFFDLLLERGANVNASGGDYCTPLQAAFRLRYMYRESWLMPARVQKLLDRGADPNIQGGRYGTALQAACRLSLYDSHDIGIVMKAVQLLIEHGAGVNTQGGHYGSALHAAASSHHPQATQVIKLLLDNGAEIDQAGNDEWKTALQVACYEGTIEVVRFLIGCGADVNAEGGRYGTPLQAAAARRLNEDSSREELQTKLSILKLLIDEGANINQHGGAALRTAALESPNEGILDLLLAHGADVNACAKDGGTALIAACRSLDNDTRCVRFLLDRGADYHKSGYDRLYDGQTAVLVARALLERGADVNAQHEKYGTALEAACAWNFKLVELLLEHGADVQLQNCAAWYEAARSGGIFSLRLLLEHGTDVNHVSQEHGTALHAAMDTWDRFGYPPGEYILLSPNKISFLLEHGIDPNVTSGLFGSALQAAAYSGRTLLFFGDYMYICNNFWTVFIQGSINLTYFNSLPADRIPSTVLTQSAKLLLDLVINHNKIRSYINAPQYVDSAQNTAEDAIHALYTAIAVAKAPVSWALIARPPGFKRIGSDATTASRNLDMAISAI